MRDQQVIVVGAGVAGLTAAYTLQQRGVYVTVLEGSERIGGRVHTDCVDGFTIDTGAQFLSADYSILLGLIDVLGSRSALTETSRYSAIVRAGRPRRVRAGRPLSLLLGGLVSGRGWFRFLGHNVLAGWRTRRLLFGDYSAWHLFDDADAAEWASACYGRESYEYIVEPMMQALCFQSPQGMSRALVLAVEKLLMRGRPTVALRGGLSLLPRLLAAHLDVRLNTSVRNLQVGPSHVVVNTDEEGFRAEHVILATTASVARAVYPQASEAEQKLMRTRYSSTLNIAVATESGFQCGSCLEDVYGILIPEAERQVIAAVTIESNKSPDLVPCGELFNVMLSDKAGRELIYCPEDEVLNRVLPELERYLPGISDAVRFVRIYRWEEAQPRSPVGRSKAICVYRRTCGPDRRVLLAGDYVGTPATEGAAETGVWAAGRILR
jgi:oxygen-dependent protoporphyrinogen oxidase